MTADVPIHRYAVFFEDTLEVHIRPRLVNRFCAISVYKDELVGISDTHFLSDSANNLL